MNPLHLSHRLQTTLQNYLTTIFDVNRDGNEPELAAAIADSFDTPGALSRGPYLEITPPYQTGATLQDLIEASILSEKFRGLAEHQFPLPPDIPLYHHQETAIRQIITQKRNIVVSSGTGSGKTESFLIPILNDLLIDPSPGVRALLIYPLNALVNDQLDRLRRLLRGTDITFGRYTSELETLLKYGKEKNPDAPPNEIIAREQIREEGKLPQILITNYAMLEYLLLRPEDSALFNSGLWRFVVLDEAHTYVGAQGIEVGMLLRRLKQRLGKQPGDMRCIVTSATLTDDDANEAVEFAENLFGEPFDTDDIIFGEINPDYVQSHQVYTISPEHYLTEDFQQLLEVIRSDEFDTTDVALLMQESGMIPPNKDWSTLADKHQRDPQRFVWEILRDNAHLIHLREYMLELHQPLSIPDAADVIFNHTPDHFTDDDKQLALQRLVELGASARLDKDEPPLLPARYHMFMRSPQGVWLCLNPDCSGRPDNASTNWSQAFSTRRDTCPECDCRVYPIKICRECGQVFVEMKYQNRQYIAEPAPNKNRLLPDYETRYFIWNSVIHENRALGADTFNPEEDEEIKSTGTDTPPEYTTDAVTLCLCCGREVRQSGKCECNREDAAHITLYMLKKNHKKSNGTQAMPYDFLAQCPRCRSDAQTDTEIATTISLNGTGPLATLTYELYRELPEAQDAELRIKPGAGRKLLTFYDSRQGAARFASYLQDIVNSDNYTHILPQAVQQLTDEENMLPNITMLSEQALDDALDYRLFHNDPTSEQWRGRDFISRQNKTTLKKRIQTRIMAEFTMRRRRRQSLESLGLVAVRYFPSLDMPPGMDTTALAETIGLSDEKTQTLIAYLLDDLRNRKIISLPRGVKPDDPLFGRYGGHPSLVRGSANPRKHQEAWIPKTNRHYRRHYVQKVLQNHQLPATNETIKETLNAIFDWLTADENPLMTGDAVNGYRLDHNQLLLENGGNWYRCMSCQRLYAHGENIPCPHHDCNGISQQVDNIRQEQNDNFFYTSFDRAVVPIRVEEHTAQLAPDKGRKYQDMFRRGDINLLSCSTTFEMGIDLGDLQAIVMSNVPPTVANYQQRAGRAGRRASGTAFILTWASGRPHDQAHFRQPPGIIQGAVRVPYIAVDNPFIRQRHVNAILLSEFLRYRQQQGANEWKPLKAFFDDQYVDTPHMHYLDNWLTACEDDVIRQLKDFAHGLDLIFQTEWLSRFQQDMNKALDIYKKQADYYRQQKQMLGKQMLADMENSRKYSKDIDKYDRLLNRLQDERLINYLSNEGVLPSYSFPLHSVELVLPVNEDDSNLRLQRDLKIAIREYAPGSEIVADKRIWRSAGVRFYRDTVRDIEYHICETCNHLKKADVAGKAINRGVCEICGQPPKRGQQVQRYIIPDGFFSGGSNNGKAARQYVRTQRSLMRSSLYLPASLNREKRSEMISFAYHRDGELLYVNEGDPRQQRAGGFRIHLADGEKQGRLATAKAEKKKLDPVALGHERKTDTLHLYFQSSDAVTLPDPDNTTFWLSLMYALIQGASHALQIERHDIDAVLHPRKVLNSNEWEQTIVLYDDVPGGAGHVKQIQQEFKSVVQAALSIVHCTDCAPETSCYHCLRDYNNQYYHYLLERGSIIRYLEALLNSLSTETYEVPGTVEVVAIDYPLWLLQQVEESTSMLRLALPELPADAPFGSRQTWMDVLLNLLQRGVQVELKLTNIPKGNHANSLSQARYLQVLIERGLRLQEIQTLPDWHMLIDEDSEETGRAVQFTDTVHLNQRENHMLTTTQVEGLKQVKQAINSVQGRVIQTNELNPPPGVHVINYDPHAMPALKTERDFFAEVFQTPVETLYINDRYLYDREQIVERVGAYIQMAVEQEHLRQVTIDTKDAATYRRNRENQTRAIEALTQKFPDVQIDVRRKGANHDRYITLTRVDGTQARILIGQGLDFIQSSVRNKPTYIVIQDPIKK